MIIKLPENAKKILDTMHEAGYEAYVVGGCVRDALLSREPGDWDITTNALPEDIKKLFTTGNRFIAGFAVSNDVGFVNDANERYGLPYIQFRAFDLERYLERKYEKKTEAYRVGCRVWC